MSERREWWIRITESPCDLAIPPGVILDDYLKSGMELVHVREVLPGDFDLEARLNSVMYDLMNASHRHAKLVEAIKVLKDWVGLPHSDQCSPEMNWAWELFCQIESEVSDENHAD